MWTGLVDLELLFLYVHDPNEFFGYLLYYSVVNKNF